MSSHVALKEWAVTIKALDEGKQVLLLRKGGIREPHKEFRVEHERFFLYPSYEHQKGHLVQSAYQGDLESTLTAYRGLFAEGQTPAGPPPQVPITHWAQVTEAVEITEPERVEALLPHYIYTDHYALERLHWQPKKPLHVLLTRVYRLAEPRLITVLPAYSGCTSWIKLEGNLTTEGLVPVLSDEEYQRRIEAVKAAIA